MVRAYGIALLIIAVGGVLTGAGACLTGGIPSAELDRIPEAQFLTLGEDQPLPLRQRLRALGEDQRVPAVIPLYGPESVHAARLVDGELTLPQGLRPPDGVIEALSLEAEVTGVDDRRPGRATGAEREDRGASYEPARARGRDSECRAI